MMKKLFCLILLLGFSQMTCAAAHIERIYMESNPTLELTHETLGEMIKTQTPQAQAVKQILNMSTELNAEDFTLESFSFGSIDKKTGCSSKCVEVCLAGVCGSVCYDDCES